MQHIVFVFLLPDYFTKQEYSLGLNHIGSNEKFLIFMAE